MKLAVALCLALCVSSAFADLYLHQPRSSNNRLNEQSADRDNGDRLFDSQNNNRGGYNVGEKTSTTFPQDITTADQGPDNTYDTTYPMAAMQYQPVYFEGSIVLVEWTNQHACGGNDLNDPQKINCNIVMQYMCQTDPAKVTDPAMQVILRDGINTQTPDAPQSYAAAFPTPSTNNAPRGHHESEAYYYECSRRSRNRGLFHADQQLNGNSALFTRQNNNGNQRGLECTEERDYYPYWAPSPWRDAAYLTDDITRCPYIMAGSQNLVDTYKCTSASPASTNNMPTDDQLYPLNSVDCANVIGGTWTTFPAKSPASAPDCVAVNWSRDNHLGNGRFGQPLSYNWTLPMLADISDYQVMGSIVPMAKCVMRLRYNISTDDYNPWSINSTADDNPQKGVVSPVQENPYIDVGADLQGLRLAVNTAQFGRTFQDRTHVFYIRPRPILLSPTDNIINLSVRGKRGNIVQTYPAVEYDFIPNRLTVRASTATTVGDYIHLQWTGSNTHNNGNPGGDGQTGDAGEGTEGTDRHNFVQMMNLDDNYPIALDKTPNHIFTQMTCFDMNGNTIGPIDCAVVLATAGQFRTVSQASAYTTNFDPLLNDAPPSLVGGVLMRFNSGVSGEFNYMCTRNNNFSNRSQKGKIIVA